MIQTWYVIISTVTATALLMLTSKKFDKLSTQRKWLHILKIAVAAAMWPMVAVMIIAWCVVNSVFDVLNDVKRR